MMHRELVYHLEKRAAAFKTLRVVLPVSAGALVGHLLGKHPSFESRVEEQMKRDGRRATYETAAAKVKQRDLFPTEEDKMRKMKNIATTATGGLAGLLFGLRGLRAIK
jgi:hypothetical protein